MSKDTENLLSQFKVVPHLEEKAGVVELPNGMRKTSNGLIIDPTKLDLLLHPKAPKSPEVTYVQEDEEEEVQPKRASARVAKRSAVRKAEAPAPVKRRITVRLIVPGVGEIPTQYEKVLRGRGVMILGVFSGSFIPKQVTVVDGELNGVVVFAEWPGERYVFNGWEFRHDSGVRCLVMVKVPERQEDAAETTEDTEELEELEDDEERE